MTDMLNSYEWCEEPTGQLKINDGFSIIMYSKLPCRFHRWMIKVLLGWEYIENEERENKS